MTHSVPPVSFRPSAASGEIFGRKPREPYAVCFATLSVSDHRAAWQRPVRLRGGYAAPFFGSQGLRPLQCVRIAAGIRPRSPQAERLALPLQASKAFTSLQGDIKGQPLPCHPEPREGSLCEYRLYFYRDPSKACVVLPCLQGVKRARRNRRRMGVCPWQLVAKSASFSAADYFAVAPPLRSG